MSETPTPKQALILWCLLGRCGTAPQSSLAPRIDKSDREALIAGRFLTAEKLGRSLRLSVTDKGWNWAGAHMRAPLPPTFRVMQDWLERVHGDLVATGRTLAEFVGPAPAEPAAEAPPARPRTSEPKPSKTSKISKTPKTFKTPKTPGARQLRDRIETAYLALTGGEKAKAVRLSALRAHLGDLDRATIDAGLAAILRGDATARLSQFSDPKSLKAADREAAFSPAGEPFHILWIQS